MNLVQSILFSLLPSKVKVFVLRRLGHDIGENVSIGLSLLIGILKISMGDNTRIGHLNIFKNVPTITMGERATIGSYNIATTNRINYVKPAGTGQPALTMGRYSAIINRHYLDIQAPISLGAYSVLGGIGTILFTHQKGLKNLNEAKPIVIGERVMVGARSVLLPGTAIADHIIVCAGSIVSGNLDQSYSLYAMQKIQRVKELDPTAAYFSHEDPLGPGD